MDLEEVKSIYDFTGKSIVITGGAGILGGEIACALVGCGAKVAILDRDPALAERLMKRFETSIGEAIVVYADVLNCESLMKAEQTVVEAFGRIDGLINSAGGNKPEATAGPDRSFFDIPPEALRFVIDLNLMGTVLATQVFARRMAEQKEGVILNFSSMAAIRPLTRVMGYAAAKAAVTNFTQWLAVHMATNYSAAIRVNAVAPGFFLTDQNRYLLTDKETGALTQRGQSIISHTPMGRFGTPEDLLGTVLWLMSPASAFVTGITVPVDGGFQSFAGV
jgi:NAD(P)-dependent dehydrogenase (short-subunit alcohol dehydrogenase family)